MKLETKIIKHDDGASIVFDYFPHNFFKMDSNTPILVFFYGVVGVKSSHYTQ